MNTGGQRRELEGSLVNAPPLRGGVKVCMSHNESIRETFSTHSFVEHCSRSRQYHGFGETVYHQWNVEQKETVHLSSTPVSQHQAVDDHADHGHVDYVNVQSHEREYVVDVAGYFADLLVPTPVVLKVTLKVPVDLDLSGEVIGHSEKEVAQVKAQDNETRQGQGR